MRDGDKYSVLIECRRCDKKWLQHEVWGPDWEVHDCPYCGGGARTAEDPDMPGRSIWAPDGCLIVWDEEDPRPHPGFSAWRCRGCGKVSLTAPDGKQVQHNCVCPESNQHDMIDAVPYGAAYPHEEERLCSLGRESSTSPSDGSTIAVLSPS